MADNVIYLDNNATTRPDPRVVQAMLPLLTDWYGNASSAHRFGARVGGQVEEARAQVAGLINARESEIVFTSGGSESDHAALHGVLAATPAKRHIVISSVEHHAVLDPCSRLERHGYEVSRIPVDASGALDLDFLKRVLRDDTALVSVMLANNETGLVFPLAEVVRIAAERRVPVHTDAVNAVGKVPIDVEALGVSLLSLSAHKIYGPKGVGALYIRRTAAWQPQQIGGGQERGRRGGTLNAPGIVGLGRACELLRAEGAAEAARIRALRDELEAALRERFRVKIIGEQSERLPNTTCACFENLPSEPIIVLLSEAGVCVSAGAACSSGSLELSHVLVAMGVPPELGHGQVRFSLGRTNSQADIGRLLEVLPGVIRKVEGAYAAAG